MVIREGTIFYRSTEQQHYFGCPYQLSSTGGDKPQDGVIRSIHLLAGDIVVCGSDGYCLNDLLSYLVFLIIFMMICWFRIFGVSVMYH